MGIKGLFPYLRENAGGGCQEKKLNEYLGCTLALDASMHLYQFLAAIRVGSGALNLSNAEGEATSHIQGFANRTVKLLEAGIKPIYVFDGSSPTMKSGTLKDRAAKKLSAEADAEKARADGADAGTVYKAASASTRVTKAHNDDVKTLLRLMGMPVVESPGEAEASCARLVSAGLAYAVATEDMDTLTFGAPKMVKNLFDVEGARTGTSRPAVEITLETVLTRLGEKKPKLFVNHASFVDFCILSGCDYLPHINGIGPATAAKLLEHFGGDLDRAVEKRESSEAKKTSSGKLVVPMDWDYHAARELFHHPDVVDPASLDLTTKDTDFAGLREFLVVKHGFDEDRVARLLARLRKARSAKPQARIDSFFGRKKKETTSPPVVVSPDKRGLAKPESSPHPALSSFFSPKKRPAPDTHTDDTARTSPPQKKKKEKKVLSPPPPSTSRITAFFSKTTYS